MKAKWTKQFDQNGYLEVLAPNDQLISTTSREQISAFMLHLDGWKVRGKIKGEMEKKICIWMRGKGEMGMRNGSREYIERRGARFNVQYALRKGETTSLSFSYQFGKEK